MDLNQKKQALGLTPITNDFYVNHLINQFGMTEQQASEKADQKKMTSMKEYNGTAMFYSDDYLKSHDIEYLIGKDKENADFLCRQK